MHDKPQLSLTEVQAAMKVMLDQASKNPARPVVLAIVDDRGDLLSYARMENCKQRPMKAAIEKAYTAAVMGEDSGTFGDRLKEQQRSVASFRDSNLTAGQGGVVVRRPNDGAVLGGVGVSGLTPQEDEDLGKSGIKAMNLG
jgi:uncharacterized protein GlcG (DUF336 family)